MRGVDGGHAGAEGEAGLRAVELGEGRREGIGRGVLDAGVGVAGPPEADEVRVVVHVTGVERGRLVDGHGCRALLDAGRARGGLDGPRAEAEPARGRADRRVVGHGQTLHRSRRRAARRRGDAAVPPRAPSPRASAPAPARRTGARQPLGRSGGSQGSMGSAIQGRSVGAARSRPAAASFDRVGRPLERRSAAGRCEDASGGARSGGSSSVRVSHAASAGCGVGRRPPASRPGRANWLRRATRGRPGRPGAPGRRAWSRPAARGALASPGMARAARTLARAALGQERPRARRVDAAPGADPTARGRRRCGRPSRAPTCWPPTDLDVDGRGASRSVRVW